MPLGTPPDGGVPPLVSVADGSTAAVSAAVKPSATVPVMVAISRAAESSPKTLSVARVI